MDIQVGKRYFKNLKNLSGNLIYSSYIEKFDRDEFEDYISVFGFYEDPYKNNLSDLEDYLYLNRYWLNWFLNNGFLCEVKPPRKKEALEDIFDGIDIGDKFTINKNKFIVANTGDGFQLISIYDGNCWSDRSALLNGIVAFKTLLNYTDDDDLIKIYKTREKYIPYGDEAEVEDTEDDDCDEW